ncbi:MAG: DUF1361 domain-containing protein [Bacteroidota bacterium]
MLQKNLSIIAWRLMLLSAFCFILQMARMYQSETLSYIFLPFNLILAWIPLLIARLAQHQQSTLKLAALLCGWIIFFPNSAYIITDLIHLKPRNDIPFWYDTTMLFVFAFTGFITGLLSAVLIYRRLKQTFSTVKCKAIMVAVMFLSGYGIYIGRFLRWNSWDIALHPVSILCDTFVRIANPVEHPQTYAVSIVTGVLLTLTFFTMESFILSSETE